MQFWLWLTVSWITQLRTNKLHMVPGWSKSCVCHSNTHLSRFPSADTPTSFVVKYKFASVRPEIREIYWEIFGPIHIMAQKGGDCGVVTD